MAVGLRSESLSLPPVQNESTSRVSSKSRNQYFSGSGLPSLISLMRSRFSAWESSYFSESCWRRMGLVIIRASHWQTIPKGLRPQAQGWRIAYPG